MFQLKIKTVSRINTNIQSVLAQKSLYLEFQSNFVGRNGIINVNMIAFMFLMFSSNITFLWSMLVNVKSY